MFEISDSVHIDQPDCSTSSRLPGFMLFGPAYRSELYFGQLRLQEIDACVRTYSESDSTLYKF